MYQVAQNLILYMQYNIDIGLREHIKGINSKLCILSSILIYENYTQDSFHFEVFIDI